MEEKILLKTWYLELHHSPDFHYFLPPIKNLHIEKIEKPPIHFYRYLYNTIGAPWVWWERKLQTDEEVLSDIHHPNVELFVPYDKFLPIGMAEIDFRKEKEAKLNYFGIFPEYYGQGIGKYLLKWTIRYVFSKGIKRYWLHTCSLDSPYALRTYLNCGFKIYYVKEEYIEHPNILIQKIKKDTQLDL